MEVHMTLGEKLSILRKENNYTQEQLAEILEVSRQSVSKWESNITFPETDKLIRLSTLFNGSIDYLIKDVENAQFLKDNIQEKHSSIDYQEAIGNWCNIDLKNWDSGYYTVALIGQDDNYVFFYQADKRGNLKYGIVAKCHIDAVTTLKTSERRKNFMLEILDALPSVSNPFDLLHGKICDIQMHSPNFVTFAFSIDGYQKATVISINDDSIKIKDGESTIFLNKKDVAGIVES